MTWPYLLLNRGLRRGGGGETRTLLSPACRYNNVANHRSVTCAFTPSEEAPMSRKIPIIESASKSKNGHRTKPGI
jgi:hypothetical protein